MSNQRIIYDTVEAIPLSGDISEATPDALIRLANDGDESAIQALADQGLNFDQIFQNALKNAIEEMKNAKKSSEENDSKGVE